MTTRFSDWPPHPKAISVLRRDAVTKVGLGTALLRANNDESAVNGLQRRKESNEPQKPTSSDENCAQWTDERNEILSRNDRHLNKLPRTVARSQVVTADLRLPDRIL